MPTSLGPAEILVILVVALIVLGPTRLPGAARQVGKALSELRRWSGGMQEELRDAFDGVGVDAEPLPPAPTPPEPADPTEPTPVEAPKWGPLGIALPPMSTPPTTTHDS